MNPREKKITEHTLLLACDRSEYGIVMQIVLRFKGVAWNMTPSLLRVAEKGDGLMMRILLDTRANPFVTRNYDGTLVFVNGVNPLSARRNDGEFPLSIAVQLGNYEMADILLCHCADVNQKLPDGNSALHVAATLGFCSIARLLLFDHKANVDAVNNSLETPMMLAARYDHADVVSLLAERGANVMHELANGTTALHLAGMLGHLDVAKCLLALHAKVDACTKGGASPLHRASYYGRDALVKLFLAHGADIDKVDIAFGATPMFYACQDGHYTTVEYLLRCNANMNLATTDDGTCPLQIAISQRHFKVVALLVEHGANLKMRRTNGGTPLFAAVEVAHVETVQLLLEAGANPNSRRTTYRETPLHFACRLGSPGKIVALLLKHGARRNAVECRGLTARKLARIHGHPELAAMLRK